MGYKSVQIPSPFDNSQFYNELKNQLYRAGFKEKHNYKGAKIVDTVRYWWDSYTLNILGHGSVTFPGGQFFAYTCTYPEYKDNKVVVTHGREAGANKFYDDSIDEVLGGNIEKLGGTR